MREPLDGATDGPVQRLAPSLRGVRGTGPFDYPWGEAELVAKVGGKAFAFIGLDGGRVGLKCGRTAEEAAEWRDRYPDAVTIGAHIGR